MDAVPFPNHSPGRGQDQRLALGASPASWALPTDAFESSVSPRLPLFQPRGCGTPVTHTRSHVPSSILDGKNAVPKEYKRNGARYSRLEGLSPLVASALDICDYAGQSYYYLGVHQPLFIFLFSKKEFISSRHRVSLAYKSCLRANTNRLIDRARPTSISAVQAPLPAARQLGSLGLLYCAVLDALFLLAEMKSSLPRGVAWRAAA